jgi:NitT/TauT family transport system substrate-binding protein
MNRFLRVVSVSVMMLAAVWLAGCKHAEKNGLIPVKLQTDWYPQPEHGGFYTALAKGYYKDAGLDVTILPGGPYVTAEQQISVGSVQFGMSSSDRMLQAVADGQPLVAVAATMQHDPQAIMVHADSPVHTFADLNGHAVSVRPGSTWFQYIEKRYNLTNVREIPATYSVANFIRDPTYIQQIFVTSEPFYAKQAGVPVRTMLISQTGYDPYRIYCTSQGYLQEHPDVVAKFVQASIHGWEDYLKDPTIANAMIRKLNPDLDPEMMKFSYEALRDGHFVDGPNGNQVGQMDPARWAAMAKLMTDLKVVDKPVDPTAVYTTKFLPK